MGPNGHSRILYLLLSAIAALTLLLAGAFFADLIAQRNRILDRLDSLDARVADIQAQHGALVESRAYSNLRMAAMEDELKAIRENIRKLY